MSEKGTSRTGRSGRTEHSASAEQRLAALDAAQLGPGETKPRLITRRRALFGLAATGLGVYYWQSRDQAAPEQTVGSDGQGPVESEGQHETLGPPTPLAIDATDQEVVATYVAALNRLGTSGGRTVDETKQDFQDYYDAYLNEDWRQGQSGLLNSEDGLDLAWQAASGVNLGKDSQGQLGLVDFNRAEESDEIYVVVEVIGYSPDESDPDYGYATAIPTRFARLKLQLADDEAQQRKYFDDAQVVGYFNQAEA